MIIFAKLLLEKQIITSQTSTALLLMAVASIMLTVPVLTPKLTRMCVGLLLNRPVHGPEKGKSRPECPQTPRCRRVDRRSLLDAAHATLSSLMNIHPLRPRDHGVARPRLNPQGGILLVWHRTSRSSLRMRGCRPFEG
jgi:hypothetical protein